MDGWKTQTNDSTEFASICTGQVYSVKGYDPTFRIMLITVHNEDEQVAWVFECFDGIQVVSGEDVFGKIKLDNIDKTFSEKQIPLMRAFLAALDEAAPLPGKEALAVIDENHKIWIRLNDGCLVILSYYIGKGHNIIRYENLFFELKDGEALGNMLSGVYHIGDKEG